jgi:hypothetical protein
MPLDEQFSEWSEPSNLSLELAANIQLQTLLTHFYVLIPVLDSEKHYWVGKDEVEKLLKCGEGLLSSTVKNRAAPRPCLRKSASPSIFK